MIMPYSRDIIDDHKTQGEWKIQLSIRISFMSSNDFDETRTMYIISVNIEIMIGIKQVESLKNFLILFCKNTKKD